MREAEERLCERFDELKPGMIVIAKRCAWCGGGSHRVMLTSFYRGPIEAIEGQVDGGGWLTQPAPPPPCSNQAGYVVSAYGVRLGKVYIVETGNDNDAEREEGRRLEKVISVRAKVSR